MTCHTGWRPHEGEDLVCLLLATSIRRHRSRGSPVTPADDQWTSLAQPTWSSWGVVGSSPARTPRRPRHCPCHRPCASTLSGPLPASRWVSCCPWEGELSASAPPSAGGERLRPSRAAAGPPAPRGLTPGSPRRTERGDSDKCSERHTDDDAPPRPPRSGTRRRAQARGAGSPSSPGVQPQTCRGPSPAHSRTRSAVEGEPASPRHRGRARTQTPAPASYLGTEPPQTPTPALP